MECDVSFRHRLGVVAQSGLLHIPDALQKFLACPLAVGRKEDAGGGLFNGSPCLVNVPDVSFAEFGDEDPAVSDADKQPLLSEAVNGFPDRSTAHAQLAGDVHLNELSAWLHRPLG